MISRRKLTLRPALSTLAGVALLLLAALPAGAEDAPAPTPNPNPSAPAARSGDWQPMQTQMLQPGESYEATHLVSGAYGFIWVMVAGFVLTVWRRADRLEKEIQALRAQVRIKAGK